MHWVFPFNFEQFVHIDIDIKTGTDNPIVVEFDSNDFAITLNCIKHLAANPSPTNFTWEWQQLELAESSGSYIVNLQPNTTNETVICRASNGLG